MAVELHMTAEERSRLWHGLAGQGRLCFQEGAGRNPTLLCRSVEGQILSVSDMGIYVR